MIARPSTSALGIVLLLGCGFGLDLGRPANAQEPRAKEKADPSTAQEKPSGKDESKTAKKPSIELATFGGGCFWCMEAVFERIPGVKSVVSGYSGGTVPDPTYEQVHTGLTGHAEVVQIKFDPSVLSYDKLLHVFWGAHDPTSLNAQEDDVGTQYRSVIFYHTEEQRKAALAQYEDLTKRRVYRRPIVTELSPYRIFFPAEPYHQNYYSNNRGSYYSQIYIDSKLRKMKLNKAPRRSN